MILYENFKKMWAKYHAISKTISFVATQTKVIFPLNGKGFQASRNQLRQDHHMVWFLLLNCLNEWILFLFNNNLYSILEDTTLGTIYGHYMMFDASSSTDFNAKGQLVSPKQELTSNKGCLEFYYNAYGFYFWLTYT